MRWHDNITMKIINQTLLFLGFLEKNTGCQKETYFKLAPGCFLKIVFQKCEVDVEQFLVWPHGIYFIK